MHENQALAVKAVVENSSAVWCKSHEWDLPDTAHTGHILSRKCSFAIFGLNLPHVRRARWIPFLPEKRRGDHSMCGPLSKAQLPFAL
ncbi:hypothetical protein XELAEV_18035618mg [Xenopus laevis]|uniref:Uncharacterized protein n=1 Tax=Xenopus laevis TaxID=8355 RepID=A0A974CH42_XENLA|nr:hypothetical protein XELAEV_18035618mg [Xenopus laevis]